MISTISLETVIILLLFLIHQSILDEFLPNLTSIAKDSTADLHYGNIDKDYRNGDEWSTNLEDKSLNIEGNNTRGINNTTINNNKTVSTEQEENRLKFDEAINNEVKLGDLGETLNSTTESKITNGMKTLQNDSLKDDLKRKNETSDTAGCISPNCENDTEKLQDLSTELTDIVQKIDTSQQTVPSSTTLSPTTEPSISFKNPKFLVDNSDFFDEEATTESNIITQLVKDVESDSDNEIDKNESSKDGNKDNSKEQLSKLESQSETSDVSSDSNGEHLASSSSGFITSTSSVDFSSILLSVDSGEHKKPAKQKGSAAHKAAVPDFTKSNGYPPHAIHGLIWEDRRYLLSVLIPVGCGILGALTMVSLAYAARNCRSRYSYHPPSMPITPEEIAYMDKIMLIPDSSDDEV